MEKCRTLPQGHHVEDGKIVRRLSTKNGDHTEIVANGTIEVSAIKQYADSPKEQFLVTRFTSSDGSRHDDVDIPVEQIAGKGNKLLDYVPYWFVLQGTSAAKRLALLQNILNLQRAEITETITIQRIGPGYHKFDDGTLSYVLGDTVLNHPPGVNIEVTSPFHLQDMSGLSGQGVAWSRRFCEQGPPQAALFAAVLTSYLRPVLEATNNLGRFGIYVCGESGTGKSETTKLLCQLFKEESGATLSSDKSDIFRMMAQCRDMPFLVDDLNNSRVANATNKKRERLSEILQQVSGTGTLSIRSETFDVGLTTPVITAESLLKSYSTINRTLIIAFEKSFNPDTMTWLQEHRSLYIDFLKGFIEWICQNHTRLEADVRSWKLPNLNGGVENPDAFVGFHRLTRTYKILKITQELLMLHLQEVYSIPPEEIRSWRRLLEEGINQAAFYDTLEHLRKDSKEQERFYVDAVLDIFDSEDLLRDKEIKCVAKSYKQYVAQNKLAKTDSRITRKVFFISSDGYYYCYRGDDLIALLTGLYDNQYKFTKKAVSAQLYYHGLLQPRGGELSYPISELSYYSSRDKKKTRYYHLRVDVVNALRSERHMHGR